MSKHPTETGDPAPAPRDDEPARPGGDASVSPGVTADQLSAAAKVIEAEVSKVHARQRPAGR
jgi:hypothetical protein